MTVTIQLTDWEVVKTELQRFGATGEVNNSGDRIRVGFGNAYIEVSTEGTISTGMPLHDFEHNGDVSLIVDHETGSISVRTDELDYTFRRP
jgi:hypothetical protein